MKPTFLNGTKLLLLAAAVLLFCEAANPQLLRGAHAAEPALAAPSETEYVHPEEFQEILRLHVVANSDSEEDQRVKLLVRDALLARFSPAHSLREAEELLLLGGEDVYAAVQEVLAAEGCAYGAQLRFGVMDFPDRDYGGVRYPAGAYEALRVELGGAVGQNWWCVLFPPLCLVDAAVQDLPDTDELVFESDLLALLRQ